MSSVEALHELHGDTVLIVGVSGFVGGSLFRILSRASGVDVTGIGTADWDSVSGRKFDTVLVAAPHAKKWWAEQNPCEDTLLCKNLVSSLSRISWNRLVLFSTIDATGPALSGWGESCEREKPPTTYGRNRLAIEEELLIARDGVQIVRLPALFGPGLKKNVLFDLLLGASAPSIRLEDEYQWYCTDWLGKDLCRILTIGEPLVFLATTPLSMNEVLNRVFSNDGFGGAPLISIIERDPIRYDVKSEFAHLWPHGRHGYMYAASSVLRSLTEFLERARAFGG